MRRLVSATLACLIVGIAATAADAAPLQPRIVGGTDTTAQDFPWQVGVDVEGLTPTADNPSGEFFCGGVIIDASHVLTAAHCARIDDTNTTSAVVPAADYTIYSGTTHINTGDPTTTTSSVQHVSPDLLWDGSNHDAAVLTLSSPLTLDGTNRMAIGLAPAGPSTGTALVVSGWGVTSENATQLSNTLQQTTVNVTDFNECKATYHDPPAADLVAADVLCAAAPGRDSCQGDSGGPLVDLSSKLLVGIVSSGQGCAEVGFPGIYTSVTGAERQFILDNSGFVSVSPAPQLTGASPTLTGTSQADSVLQCSTGTWSGNPSFTFTFLNQSAGGATLASGASGAYTLTAADVGRMIACRVRAHNTAGDTDAQSNNLGPVTATPPPPLPPTPPTPTPEPQPQTPVQTKPLEQLTVIPQVDDTAPHTRIKSAKCTRTRCVLHITATDAGFSSGIAGVTATVRTTTTRSCVVNHRRRSCTRKTTKIVKPILDKSGDYVIIASNLPYGSHRFSVSASDKAGNTQPLPTTKTTTTRAPRTKKK